MITSLVKSPRHSASYSRRSSGQHITHNLIESDKEFVIELAAPGFAKSDFSIRWDHDYLIVDFERPSDADDIKYIHRGFALHNFSKSFRLKAHLIETQEVSAKYINGLLRIHLPKSAAGLNLVRTITVD